MQTGIDPDRLVFLDEFGATTKLTRTHGRAPQGTRLVEKVPHGHWKSNTFVAGLRSTGLVAPLAIDGAMNGDLFVGYVTQHLAPLLNPGDLVILDNLPSHQRTEARHAIEAVGAHLVFLPPYSPDLNPIEQAISKLKRLLRTAKQRTVDGQENCKVDLREPAWQERRSGQLHGGHLFSGKEPWMHAATLLDVFSRLDDPRRPRGVRHPFAGMVVLMLLGMLARIREMEVLVRWATIHWDRLREPLGFDRDEPPCTTTISRTLAKCRVVEFQAALAVWLQACLADKTTEGVVAVDGKTAKQGLDDNGDPLHMLNVFVHDLQAVVGQWSTGTEKTNEPTLLRRHLEALLDTYPMLRLFAGDAIFAQRPLAELVCGHGRDYLLQVKGNQGDTLRRARKLLCPSHSASPSRTLHQ